MPEQVIICPQPFFSVIPANTVVGPLFGGTPVFDFAGLPGTQIAMRVYGRVSAADSPAKVQVNARVVTPPSDTTPIDHTDSIICATNGGGAIGFVSGAAASFAKPSGLKKVNLTAQMDTAGKAGAIVDFYLALALVDAPAKKLWHLWRSDNQQWDFGTFSLPELQPGTPGVGGISFFDFSQIPAGALCTIAVAGMTTGRDVVATIRVSDLSGYNDATGTVVASGTFSRGPGSAAGSAVGTFVNAFSGVKVIKIVGYAPTGSAGQGTISNTSVVLWY